MRQQGLFLSLDGIDGTGKSTQLEIVSERLKTEGWPVKSSRNLGGTPIGRIQTFVPAGRPLPPGTFEIGIALREDMRGRGHGREALTLLTGWLFRHAGAAVVEAPTDPGNVAMRTVFGRAGWTLAGTLTEYGREWVMYRITRPEWAAREPAGSR